MQFDPCPERLVVDGAAQLGVFDSVPAHPDLKPLRGLRGLGRFKVWHHLVIDTPTLRGTIAMVDLGYLRTAWFWALPELGDIFELAGRTPLCRMKLARGTTGQRSTSKSPQLQVELEHIGPQQLLLKARGRGHKLELHLDGRAIKPLSVCLPIGDDSTMYSQKMPCTLQGQATIHGRKMQLECRAMLDTHQAYYPAHTEWRWATAAWQAGERLVAFNLTRNQAVDPERYHECALWIGDRLERLPLPEFSVPSDAMTPWSISSPDGAIDLNFEPIAARRDDTNIGPLRIWYVQPFGRFTGGIRDRRGEVHEVDAMGVCEDHKARW